MECCSQDNPIGSWQVTFKQLCSKYLDTCLNSEANANCNTNTSYSNLAPVKTVTANNTWELDCTEDRQKSSNLPKKIFQTPQDFIVTKYRQHLRNQSPSNTWRILTSPLISTCQNSGDDKTLIFCETFPLDFQTCLILDIQKAWTLLCHTNLLQCLGSYTWWI